MIKRSLTLCAVALASVPVTSQLPTPNPQPRVAPRATWVRTTTNTNPSQRRDNPGAASLDKLYMFGGRDQNAGSAVLNALYEFDGSTWTLKTAEGAVGSPPARGGACVAWDFPNNRLIVFGGDTGGSAPALLGDIWSWDPTTNTWTDLTTAAGPGPSARRYAAMAYDPYTQGMLLFGGEPSLSPPTPTNETWLFIGNTWVQLAPATLPPARGMASLCTRDDFGDVVMCFGRDQGGTTQIRLLDIWSWTGTDWLRLPDNGTIPHGTTANQAIYDPLRRRIVVQGGQGISVPNTANGGIYGDLYGGSPSNWTSEYDSLAGQWYLYGDASWNTTDPVIGRISRYFAGFIAATGKIYKASGQNPAGGGSVLFTYQYQAAPVASATQIGTGCAGGGGVLSLDAVAPNDRPWLGRSYGFRVTNLAPAGIPLWAIGFTQQAPALPLSLLVPQGLPGCTLDVSLDLTFLLNNVGGVADGSLVIPVIAGIAGGTLYHQVLQAELGGGGSLAALSSSNGQALLLGEL
ncbi:MAG: hypothetical protein IPM29_29265 [Planctomycetes bacterium]|nr:hypothetical protein [Planctomycetota bacterium]